MQSWELVKSVEHATIRAAELGRDSAMGALFIAHRRYLLKRLYRRLEGQYLAFRVGRREARRSARLAGRLAILAGERAAGVGVC